MSTILKIFVGFLNFIVAALLIRNALITIKVKGKILSNKIYITILVVVLIASSIYTIIDGYDAGRSNDEISNLQKKIDTLNIELKIARSDRDEILSSTVSSNVKLIELQNSLNPFLILALEKYPGIDTTLALSKLYKEIDQIKINVHEVSLQSEFKPINTQSRSQIISNLRKSETLKNVQFMICDWSGRLANKLIANEISDIIKEAGLPCQVKNMFGMQGGYIVPPVEINVDPNNIKAYNEFVQVFEPLFYEYTPKRRSKGGYGNLLRVRIFGSPTFKLDGRIKYQ